MAALHPSAVYHSLSEHQRAAADWRHQPTMKELHIWAERFATEFKLQLPAMTLAVDRTRSRRCLGHYRPGYNGLGLRCEIVISESHLERAVQESAWWRVLGTLLHEELHCWQEFHGKSGRRNYHNVQFRRKATELGLIVDERGVTRYDPGSPFFALLERHGVQAPALPKPNLHQSRTKPVKLHLWVCGCTKVRVGRAHFNAKCLDCGNQFELVE
jgi:hypothetical protein